MLSFDFRVELPMTFNLWRIIELIGNPPTLCVEHDREGRKSFFVSFHSGPLMSPLTTSFFTCWAFFDACVGLAEETIGTTIIAVGSAFGMHEELVRVIGLMQDSRMAVYAHEGTGKDTAVLRELVTNKACKAICPLGYHARMGVFHAQPVG